MEIRTLGAFVIRDSSQVAEARRFAGALTRGLGFNEADSGRVSIVVTEAATNLLKHAGEGELVFNALHNESRQGLGILSLDRGPGIASVAESLRDGYSTVGSPGTGLGAIARMASRLEIYSQPGQGTAMLVRIWPAAAADQPPWPLETGSVSVPKPGEEVSGDAWLVRVSGPCARIAIADGLGHGMAAAEAAGEAIKTFSASSADLTATLEDIHAALRHTRGAVVALTEIDTLSRVVRFAGVGNISATIVAPERDYNMVSHNGTMGQEVRKIQEFTYPWPQDSVLVLHSDGISRRWDLRPAAGLLARHPALIAGVLYRDHKRERDDATVVVARDAEGAGR